MEGKPHAGPRRIILRTREQYGQNCVEIIEQFFNLSQLQIGKDYFWHLVPETDSPVVHIVLDVLPSAHPQVDPNRIEHTMYKVYKRADLSVQCYFVGAANGCSALALLGQSKWTYYVVAARH